MRLGIVSQWFAPEEMTIPNSLAEASVLSGDEVTVLTAFPSYPHGTLYDGYSQQAEFSEKLAGVLIYRVRSFLSHDAKPMNRIRSFLSYSAASVTSAHVLARNDVNYVYGTPMTAAWAAWWVKVRYGVPYVLHVQDLWPESVTNSGMVGAGLVSKVLDGAIALMLKPLYSGASAVVAIAPTMAKALTVRGVPKERVVTILNWDSGSNPKPSSIRVASYPLRFVYAGNLGIMQDIETIVRAAALVRDYDNIEFHIYGSGVLESSLWELARALGVSNLTFHGRVSKSAMKDIYAVSDYQFVTLKNRPLFHMTIPSKFQASLANGVPVITTVQGDLAELCSSENVGITARPEDPESLADAIRAAALLSADKRREMEENCRNLYNNKLSPERGIGKIRAVLHEAAQERKASN